MSISMTLCLTNEVPPETFETLHMSETPGYGGAGTEYSNSSGLSAAVWYRRPYDWDMVVAEIGIDYRWVVSMVPLKDDIMARIDAMVDVGVHVITRAGGEGIFSVDRGTILMVWSGKNVAINPDVPYLDKIEFDDTFTVTRAVPEWNSDVIDALRNT